MLRMKTRDVIFRLVRAIIVSLAIMYVATMAKDAVVALSGQSTNVFVQAGMSFLASMRLIFSFSLTGVAALWAVVERATRQKQAERLHGRIKELERQIDPQRSSSKLTRKGKTNPKDKAI